MLDIQQSDTTFSRGECLALVNWGWVRQLVCTDTICRLLQGTVRMHIASYCCGPRSAFAYETCYCIELHYAPSGYTTFDLSEVVWKRDQIAKMWVVTKARLSRWVASIESQKKRVALVKTIWALLEAERTIVCPGVEEVLV